MSKESVEQLESIIAVCINNLYKDVPPTEEEFKEIAAKIQKEFA